MKVLLGILIFLSLTSCAPTSAPFFYKMGSDYASKQRDMDQCKIRSFKDVPQNMVTTYTPPVNIPGTTSCNSIGGYMTCNEVGGYHTSGSSFSSDVNQSLRERVLLECMNNKGYKAVVLTFCKEGERGYNSFHKSPELNKIKCLEPNSPGILE